MPSSPEHLAWLKRQLGDGCVEVPVQGDRPLLLDDPSCAYLTLSEHHQVFCVGYEGGRAVGRREHMAVCGAGQLLFGLEPEAREGVTALILSGVTGSVVWRVPTALLFRLADKPQGLEAIGSLFDAWIALLIATLPAAPVPTRTLALAPTESAQTDGALAVRSEQGLVWIAPRVAPRSFVGIDPAAVGASADCWPLAEQTWAQLDADRFRVWKSTELLASTKGAAFAEGFYRFVVRVVGRRRSELASERLVRDVASRESELRLLSESLERLSRAGRAARLDADFGASTTAELDRACQTAARWLRIDPPRVVRPEGPAISHTQAALARSTGIRTRRVVLERGWQRHDSGALVGFTVEGDARLSPVALLPSRRGYWLHDGRSSAPEKVTEEVAARVYPHAHQIYAPMPNRPLGPFDVLRFSSARTARDWLFVAVVGMLTGALGTLVPVLTGQIFDYIIPGAERALLGQLTAVLVAVLAGQLLFDLARGLVLTRAQTLMEARLEAGVWDRLLGLPLPFFRRYSAGDLAARAAGVGGMRQILAGATVSGILGGIFSLWNLALLFVIDTRLAGAAFGLVALAGAVAAVAALERVARQRKVAELDGKIGGLLLQLFAGVAKLRITGAESRAFSIWSSLFARRRDADWRAERLSIRVAAFEAGFPFACSITLWLLVSLQTPRLSTGRFLAFSAAFGLFVSAMLEVIETGLYALTVIPLYERAKPILTEPVEHGGGGEGRITLAGHIEVSHVSFRYEEHGPLILDDVHFTVRPGEFVAIVGTSGSGKSTLLRILLGFEACAEGAVFYDGQALASLDVRVVRQQIGVVLQNSRVMAGDIYSNIVGTSGGSMEDAWRAARAAALDKDIEAMPMGMHTVLSQGGSTLSGGQRQRLLIARSLALRPAILFFDEATSALDNVTQSAVSESLERLRVTRVVIAHRLSTIRHADKIVVLERGRVVQVGRFAELFACEGAFLALARRQM